MAFERVWRDGGCEIVWSGDVTGGEVASCVLSTPADSRFESARWLLIDASRCRTITFDESQMSEVGAFAYAARLENPRIRVAAFPSRPDLVALVATLNSFGFESFDRRVFDDREQALAWLGVRPA